jgi:hypothetical protein
LEKDHASFYEYNFEEKHNGSLRGGGSSGPTETTVTQY